MSPRCCCCLEGEGDEGLARFVHETEDGESSLHHLPSSPPHLAHPSCIRTLLTTKQRKRHTCFVCRRKVVGYLHFTPLRSVNPWKPKVYVCGTPLDDATHCLLPKGHLGPCSYTGLSAGTTGTDPSKEGAPRTRGKRTREGSSKKEPNAPIINASHELGWNSSEEENGNEESFFNVRKIHAHKRQGGRLVFHVEWDVDWDAERTWEPLSSFPTDNLPLQAYIQTQSKRTLTLPPQYYETKEDLPSATSLPPLPPPPPPPPPLVTEP